MFVFGKAADALGHQPHVVRQLIVRPKGEHDPGQIEEGHPGRARLCLPTDDALVEGMARGAGLANVTTPKRLAEFEAGFLCALKSHDLSFILAKVEPGAGDVPAAALDSQENKYSFVRYIEKSENLKILTATPSRASEPRPK